MNKPRYTPKETKLFFPKVSFFIEATRVLNAVLFVLKSGCPWRLLPKDFPAWKTVYHHFRAWSRSGVLMDINARLRKMVRRLEGRNIHPSAGIIDSQSVRSNGHSGLVGYDAGKKIKGRKRFVCVDILGLLLGVVITPANVSKELLRFSGEGLSDKKGRKRWKQRKANSRVATTGSSRKMPLPWCAAAKR